MLHIRSWSGGYFAAVDALYTFVIATVASFIGSLQAGLVNTAVLAHTIQRGRDAGRRMAVDAGEHVAQVGPGIDLVELG